MSNFSQGLNRWLTDILSEVGTADQKKQRKTKTFINRKNKKAEYRNITDITFTRNQDKYPNTSIPLVVKDVLGNNLDTQCFVDTKKIDTMLENRAAALFKLGDYSDRASIVQYEVLIDDFKRSFNSTEKAVYDNFLTRLLDEKSSYRKFFPDYKALNVKKDLKDAQLRFLAKAYVPSQIWVNLKESFSNKYDDLFRIIQLIRDTQLRKNLEESLPKTAKSTQVINQFLNNRLSGLGAEVSQELQAELAVYFPEVNMNTESNINKCVMSLFLNIKKALSARKQGPKNLKRIVMPQGLDRRNLPPEWAALVRPERAKVALRHAIHSYTSGLNLIAKGISENNSSYLVRGYSFIFNIRSREFERHVNETTTTRSKKRTLAQSCPLYDMNSELTDEFTCDEFRRRTCAASALLIAYFEIMDTLVSPSPPLITRQNMQVREFYVNPHKIDESRLELYDVRIFSDWSSDKKRAFLKAYERFVARYRNVGFVTTDQVGPHGMRLLNLLDWGKPDQAVVANPFRVREDTFIFKYFGSFRLEFNRCSIGEVSRSIWKQHQISYNYDPDYCSDFIKYANKESQYGKNSRFPRPIFDINHYAPSDRSDVGSPLYFNVSSFEVNGPQPACARRDYLNKMNMKSWVEILEDKAEGSISPSLQVLKEGKFLAPTYTKNVTMSREANAMLDVHENFRTISNPFRMPLIDAKGEGVQFPTCFAYDIDPTIDPNYRKYLLYRPIVSRESKTSGSVTYTYGKQGIERNPSGWVYWRNTNGAVFSRDPLSTYQTNLNSPNQVDRMYTEPPPALFNRLNDPVTNVPIPLQFFQQVAHVGDTEAWPEYNDDEKDDCRNFYANFLTQSLKNMMKCLKGLPSWFVTNFTDLTIDIAYPYPLLTDSGDLDANVLPIGYSDDGSPPFRLVPSSIYVLVPNRKNNFWDLRNSLVYLLSDQRLFASVEKAQSSLEKYLLDNE
jgi:hypothetical protein